MKKRPFLLLEVCISLTLVSLCVLPLVRYPLQMFTKELAQLEVLEKERLANWAFSEVKEQFLKQEIPWKDIPALHEKTGPFLLPDMKLKLAGRPEKTFATYFTLYGKGQHDGRQGEEFRQIYVSIFLHEKGHSLTRYEYRLPLQKS